MRIVAGMFACALASGAAADDFDAQSARLGAAFEVWLDTHGTPGTMAVMQPDGTLVTFSLGVDAETPIELASLSKSVTAVCAAELVAQGTLDWSDTVADLLGQGPDVSLSMLLTHASGLTQDSTQILMGDMLDSSGSHQSQRILDAVDARRGPAGARGSFAYNNENYALAGLMIEAASGQPYDEVCNTLAITPSGATARPSDRLPGALPWGSWTMSVADYARFHRHWFANMDDPESYPYSDAGGGIRYGLGTFFRKLARGETYWHFGAHCFPGRYQRGSYAVTWFADWTVVASYETCVDWDAMFALDQTLAQAVFGKRE